MSKVICDVCGTSYPETSTQCPICGCVRPVDAPGIMEEDAERRASGTYQHVKGGRFSNANVRKRNASKQAVARKKAAPEEKAPAKKRKKKNSGNTGLIITIIVLLLAILAVVGYIIVKFFLPAEKPENQEPEIVTTGLVEDPTPETDPEILCEEIVLDASEFVLNAVGEQASLNAVFTPADTTDVPLFVSNNEAVATVDQAGMVTAVDFGEATITVSCGDITVQCTVVIEEPFALDMDSVTFSEIGTPQTIYSGTIPLGEITWKTDDESVAVVADGVITAVGAGSTTVYGEYNGTILSCSVVCDVSAPTISTEAPAATVAPAPYKLKNLVGGSNSDVTLKVGEKFSLALMDANGNKIEDAKWSVDGSSCTVDGGLVKAVSSGKSVVTVTYNGETFECIVRVS